MNTEQERQRIVAEWMRRRPDRANMKAWVEWLLDMADDLARFDRAQRRVA